MMDKPELRTVARPGSEQARSIPEPPKKTSTFSWRTISFVAAPLVLGLINLVEAHFERRTAFVNGQIKYLQLVGEGQEALTIAPEGGKIAGQQRKKGMIEEARAQAIGTLESARAQADIEVQNGNVESALVRRMGLRTSATMRPLHEVMENLLHITSLALLKNEGIKLSVAPILTDVAYQGRGTFTNESSELDRRVRAMGDLVESAYIKQSALSNAGSRFQGCREKR